MKEYEKDFYLRNLAIANAAEDGADDARRFGWQSAHTQNLRFLALLRLIKIGCDSLNWDPATISILDYGCGDGLFFHQARKMGIGKTYIGIDAMKESISQAKIIAEMFDLQAEFTCFAWDGFEDLPISGPVDFVVESGAFATTPAAIRTTMLLKLFEMPSIGFAGTFLMPSNVITGVDGAIILSPPAEIISAVNTNKYNFVMLADYLRHDYALGVYKIE
jgi:SAM-dependent methyltransferase